MPIDHARHNLFSELIEKLFGAGSPRDGEPKDVGIWEPLSGHVQSPASGAVCVNSAIETAAKRHLTTVITSSHGTKATGPSVPK